MSRVSCIRSLVVAALVIALSVFANTGADAEASSAVDEIRSLYAEFQAFKNEDEFRRVGYGRCCKYYQWMKKVEALRGNDAGEFFRSFGNLPGELISLGMEYYQGRGCPTSAPLGQIEVIA